MISVDYLSKSELKQFETYLKKQDLKAYRVWRLMLQAVLRVDDALSITVADAKKALKQGTLVLAEKKAQRNGKATRTRKIAVNSALAITLTDAIGQADKNDWTYLFESTSRNKQGEHKPLSRHFAYKHIKAAGDTLNRFNDTDLKIGCHTARKTAGALLRKQGVDTAIISAKVFGHTSEKVTRHYLGITDDCTNSAFDILGEITSDDGDAHLQDDLALS